jgi:mRNA interferase RelE/StbE
LKSLSTKDKVRLVEKIQLLGENPDNPKLDTKKLTGVPYFRLRVGDWRIIYDRLDDIRVISIEKIGARGGVYK